MRLASNRGATLLEVVAAIALMAGSLLSVATLLSQAARQIAGGRNSSLALAAARDVMERTAGWSVRRTLTTLGCDHDQATCIVSFTERDAPTFAKGVGAGLVGSRTEVALHALDAPTLAEAVATRVTVRVAWREGLRKRHVRLVTVKL